MKVIIKGALADAIVVARRHGLEFEYVSRTTDTVVGFVIATDPLLSAEQRCAEWFGELALHGAPWPAGSLLWYGREVTL